MSNEIKNDVVISIKNLKKSFGDLLVFENVNLDIKKGDCIVIIGGSGCGKSTLLRCINKLNVPDAGEIIFDGKNILGKDIDIDSYRRRVGMVYQHFNLFSHLNLMENMMLAPMKVLKKSEEEAAKRAEELLELVGLYNHRFKMPSQLSGGQKQRVAIARTLAMDPDVILFDEPTSALDPTMVDEVENVIKKLIDNGMTSVIVTHDMRFAQNISTKAIFLAEKGIYEEGYSSELFSNPKKELTRQFLYRARMFERQVSTDDIDLYKLSSDTKKFLSPYGLSPKQSNLVSLIYEEIVYPIIKDDVKVTGLIVNVIGSENGLGHKMFIRFTGLFTNPLESEKIDEIGMTLVKGIASSLTSEKNSEGSWEVQVVF